ncbi:MAG: SUMF1/EgtB/PvdO family nonheme iron enzyme [Acidobacteriia bacterium]|nr:SUMF1/EgtB/PvdO family nonheme iron enzyme [Terriglobia bacterium]
MKRSYAFPILFAALAVAAAIITAAPPAGCVNSIGMALVRIAPGTFQMGVDSTPLPNALIKGPSGVVYDRPSDAGDYDEVPVHKVIITQPFWISVTEVTADQYRQFRPAFRGNPYYAPYASGVSWNDAVAFSRWLSEKEGKTYRLPTEAEWEFACRAGTRTAFSSGAQPPAPETANAWGVKNMHSGVAEWVFDWHGMYLRDAQTDPVGPEYGIAKVVRGGGLDYRQSKTDGGKHLPAEMPYYARSANRAAIAPGFESPEHGIGFRVVQADLPKTKPLPYEAPLIQTAVKQTVPDLTVGPNPSKPYYNTRPIFPNLGNRSMRDVGWKIGLKPGLGVAYHNSALQVCPNGDLIAAYYNTPKEENDPDQTILTMRLRYGAEDWDMPEPWPDFPDAADAAPVFWNDRGKLWFFFGSPRLLGGPPFQFMTSIDNGATWGAVEFPKLEGAVGKFTPQPTNSVVRDRNGVIYLPVDGSGGTSVLFASKDDGKTWHDTGGRTAGRHTTLVLGKDGSLIGFGGKNTEIDGFMPKAISRDGGKSYEKSKTPFRPLGSGQRPSIIRLASGRLFFVADLFDKKKLGAKGAGAFVALSDDDGETWETRQLPGITTVGYTTATQGPNGVIHVVTSKNNPDLHIELNETWVLKGPATNEDLTGLFVVNTYRENYPSGKIKATWSAAVRHGGYLLEGQQTFYYENGQKQWEAGFQGGRKTGVETWWSEDGHKLWEKNHSRDGVWTWKLFDAAGRVTAESRWKGKDLLDANMSGSLAQ